MTYNKPQHSFVETLVLVQDVIGAEPHTGDIRRVTPERVREIVEVADILRTDDTTIYTQEEVNEKLDEERIRLLTIAIAANPDRYNIIEEDKNIYTQETAPTRRSILSIKNIRVDFNVGLKPAKAAYEAAFPPNHDEFVANLGEKLLQAAGLEDSEDGQTTEENPLRIPSRTSDHPMSEFE